MISGITSTYTYMSYAQQSQTTQNKAMDSDLFKALDEDGNNGIDKSELDTWAKKMSAATGKTIDSTNAISTYDTDGDGMLRSTELKSFLDASGIKGPGGGPRPDLFSALDMDSSGGIDQTELDTWAKDISGKTGDTIDTSKAISTYDTDSDGVLSTTELKSFLDASGIQGPAGGPPPGPPPSEASVSGTDAADGVITGFDKNGDGVLNSSELQDYLDDTGQTSADSDLSSVSQAISAYLANMGKSAGMNSSLQYSSSLNLSIDLAA
jgi:Ca2+-binding EF-hand superfamily protein